MGLLLLSSVVIVVVQCVLGFRALEILHRVFELVSYTGNSSQGQAFSSWCVWQGQSPAVFSSPDLPGDIWVDAGF